MQEMATRSEPFSGCQLEPKGSRVKLSLQEGSRLVPSRLSLSLLSGARAVMGKRETDGERRPSFAFPITRCSRRARYAKTTGDESGVGGGGGGCRCILQMLLMDCRRSQPQFQESDTLKNSFEPGFDYALYNVVIKPE